MIWNLAVGKAKRIALEAARWRAEMEEPSSNAQVEAFEAWLKSDPAHLTAYHEVDAVADVGARLPATSHYHQQSALVVQRYRPAFALAAVAILIFAVWGLLRNPSPAYAAVTNRGQASRIVALNDGSIVTLDTATTLEVAVAPTAHHVKMASGRARFIVRLSSDKPLRVTAPAGEITSANGVFDVTVVDRGVRVWVISGSAKVLAPTASGLGAPLSLGSGQGVRMEAGVVTAMPIARADTSWPNAHVAFDKASLASIVSIANRGGVPTISLADDTIAELQVTGVMDLRDTRKLARKVAAALNLQVVEQDGALRLTR